MNGETDLDLGVWRAAFVFVLSVQAIFCIDMMDTE